jgi:surfeit locus 1 family protein
MKSTRGFFSWKWILTTLLVLAAAAVMVRLGIWQLDRLAQRRVFNARVTAKINMPALDFNQELKSNPGITSELYDMEYRDIRITGEYDFSQQILLRNQVWDTDTGYRILTPLKITGSDLSILVDRGWIPYDQSNNLQQYDEVGEVTVAGKIRRGQPRPDFGGIPDPTFTPGGARLSAINLINLDRIQQQTVEKLVPVYVQEAPDPAWTRLPYRSLADVDLSEGPHLGYAIQWFIFATILLVGYPFFVRRQLARVQKTEAQKIIGSRDLGDLSEEWSDMEADQVASGTRDNHHGEEKVK